ncbi:MAG: transporter substrate-binding domain-containing protein [Coriobacteriia bacterium]|nr:transporter substrate-binding domain-containing protein [Coriobacteriia bacterium]
MFRKTRLAALTAAVLAAVLALVLSACGNNQAGGAGDENAGNFDGTFTVAMEAGYAPYNWTQSDDSNGAVPIKDSSEFANGYDVMMAKKIAEENGWDLEIVKLDWDSLVMAVQSGTVDAAIAGQSITAERAQQVDFSDPYYFATISTLVKKDGKFAGATQVSDLDGATVNSQMNTIWYDSLAPQIPNADILPAATDAPSMLVQLESGAADVIVTDKPTAQAAEIAYPDMLALDFGGGEGDYKVSEEDVNIGISVQKGNAQLLDGINKVLGNMNSDDFDAMMNDAIKIQPLSNN